VRHVQIPNSSGNGDENSAQEQRTERQQFSAESLLHKCNCGAPRQNDERSKAEHGEWVGAHGISGDCVVAQGEHHSVNFYGIQISIFIIIISTPYDLNNKMRVFLRSLGEQNNPRTLARELIFSLLALT
jgi:hypothetical protein